MEQARLNFKDYDIVIQKKGWAKMYYNFTDLDKHYSLLLLNYLIDTQPIPEGKCLENGKQDYLRYSDSFIQMKLGNSWTNHIINQALDDLVANNYIDVYLGKGKHTRGFKVRYIKLNYDKLAYALGIDVNDLINNTQNSIQNGIQNSAQNSIQNSTQNSLKNLNQNKISDYQNNKISEDQTIFNENGQTKYSTIKDLLNNIDIDNNVRLELNKFFDRPKVKGIYSVDTAKDVIEELQKQYSNNDDIINKIKEANLHGWTSLFYNRIQNTQDTINNQQSSGIERTDWNSVPDELKQLRY